MLTDSLATYNGDIAYHWRDERENMLECSLLAITQSSSAGPAFSWALLGSESLRAEDNERRDHARPFAVTNSDEAV